MVSAFVRRPSCRMCLRNDLVVSCRVSRREKKKKYATGARRRIEDDVPADVYPLVAPGVL